ncbi:MAG: hypothetical protein CMI90_01510 [Pelagibacteraceae bacterium]|nr:hypothetical protein [Pelagibacteraceae bacterium]
MIVYTYITIMSNKNISILFTGQGSQYPTMGLELIEKFDWIKERYQISSDLLGFDVIKIQSDPNKINLTEFSQPLIFIYSSILIDLFKEIHKEIIKNNKIYLAGHSLGEYLALYFSNTLNFEEMLKLVALRGKAMSKVSNPDKYGMYAILTKTKIDAKIFTDKVYLANINSINQVVICGEKKNLEDFKLDNPIGKYIPLKVSAPFHSPIMKESSEIFLEKAKIFSFKKSNYDLLSNHKLTNYKNIELEDYANQLSKQILSTVEWTDIINYFISKEVNNFFEIGPKKTLLNFLPKNENIITCPFCSYEDINNYV